METRSSAQPDDAHDAASAPDAPAEAPRAGRRQEIVRAAEHLFSRRGYRASSLRDISREVGISHPGVLHHFTSKEALLAACIDEMESSAQSLIDHIEEIEAGPEQLMAVVHRTFGDDAQLTLLLAVLSAEAVNPDLPGRMRLIRLRRVHERVIERILGAYAEQGLLRPGIDLAWASRTLVSSVLAHATREATIGAIQPAAAGQADPDCLALFDLLRARPGA